MNLVQTVGDALALGRNRSDGDILTITTAQALLAYVVGKGRPWLLAHPEAALTVQQAQHFTRLLERAAAGEPLAHLTGEREFYGLPFTVTPDVLVPRPETETVVDVVLAWIRETELTAPRIVDVGTGSGAIAATLAHHLPDARLTGVEISREALDVARENARRHGVEGRLDLVQSDLLEALIGPFDVIAANLPYINQAEIAALDVGKWEPRVALDGGEDGLTLVRRLLGQAPTRLADKSLLVLEIGYDQGSRVIDLSQTAFPEARVTLQSDLAKLDRIVVVEQGKSDD